MEIPSLPQQENNPLHVAASLGPSKFVRLMIELMIEQTPEIALSLNKQCLTMLHLVVAKGHRLVVKELLESKLGSDLCLLRDNNGLLPIYTAAMQGTLLVLMHMVGACLKSVIKEEALQRDNILQLAIHLQKKHIKLTSIYSDLGVEEDWIELKGYNSLGA